MARGAAKQKPKSNAQITQARRPGAGGHQHHQTKTKGGMAVEDTMFFPRLRNHAKPVFVFLAVIFGVGFIFLGVGSGSSGISDLLDPSHWFGGGASTTSIHSLQKKADQHPDDAQAHINLAIALDGKNRSPEALQVLENFSATHPKESSVLSDLAGRYESQAQTELGKAQDAQLEAADISGSTLFPTLKLGKDGTGTIGTDPVVDAVTSKAQTASSNSQLAAQQALTKDVGVLKKLVKLTPDDTISIIRLGNAAAQTGDNATAIANYKRFLKLAPDDPQAALVKSRLKQLQAPAPTVSGG